MAAQPAGKRSKCLNLTRSVYQSTHHRGTRKMACNLKENAPASKSTEAEGLPSKAQARAWSKRAA